MSKKQSPRNRNMMYVQKIDHLPAKDLATLKISSSRKSSQTNMRWIVHNKEKDADGNPLTPDIHVMMTLVTHAV